LSELDRTSELLPSRKKKQQKPGVNPFKNDLTG